MFELRASGHLLPLMSYGEYFQMGSGSAKGPSARGFTPLRLSIMACPSAVRAVCREAETCPCEGSAAQPLRWPPAFRWGRLERRLPSLSDCCAPAKERLFGCLALLVAPRNRRSVLGAEKYVSSMGSPS